MTNYLFSKFNKRGLIGTGLFWGVKFSFPALLEGTFHITVIQNDQMSAMCFRNAKQVLKQALSSKPLNRAIVLLATSTSKRSGAVL